MVLSRSSKGSELSLEKPTESFQAQTDGKWHSLDGRGGQGGRRQGPRPREPPTLSERRIGRRAVCAREHGRQRMNECERACREALLPPFVAEGNILYVLCLEATELPHRALPPRQEAYSIWSLGTNMERKPQTQNVALYTELLNTLDVRLLNLITWLSGDLQFFLFFCFFLTRFEM